MGTFYAAVEVFDQSADVPGTLKYGGEARFFVLGADDLAEALATLANSIVANGLRLDRILYAGAVADFDDTLLPFEVDIENMAAAAEESGEICASEPHPFEPDETDGPGSGVYAVCLDAFDEEWADGDEDDYAGHYQLAVIRAGSAAEALQTLIESFAAEGMMLLALEGLVDSDAFPFDAYEFGFDAEDAIAEVLDQGGIILSDAFAYPPEAPPVARRLDS